jgi:hypothetical protein
MFISGTKDTFFHERYVTHRFSDFSSDIVQISMAIQKSKYDGTINSLNKWAINKVEADEHIDNEEESNK